MVETRVSFPRSFSTNEWPSRDNCSLKGILASYLAGAERIREVRTCLLPHRCGIYVCGLYRSLCKINGAILFPLAPCFCHDLLVPRSRVLICSQIFILMEEEREWRAQVIESRAPRARTRQISFASAAGCSPHLLFLWLLDWYALHIGNSWSLLPHQCG